MFSVFFLGPVAREAMFPPKVDKAASESKVAAWSQQQAPASRPQVASVAVPPAIVIPACEGSASPRFSFLARAQGVETSPVAEKPREAVFSQKDYWGESSPTETVELMQWNGKPRK